ENGQDLARHRPIRPEERVVVAVDLGVELLDLLRRDALAAQQVLDADGPGELLVGDEPGAQGAQTETAVLGAAEDAAEPAGEVGTRLPFYHEGTTVICSR